MNWDHIPKNTKGAFFVIIGGFFLIVSAALVKHLGENLPTFEILFVRFLAGFIAITPVVYKLGIKILKTQRIFLHATRGFVSFMGNMCFFFALVHIPLADTVTIQFSRPLFMVLIAILVLKEVVDHKRGVATLIGFGGILLITKPFGGGFDPWALVALSGTFFGTLVVLTVKILSRTENTVTIMFYYALSTTVLAFIPAVYVWQNPTWIELILLLLTGILGMLGQGLFTHGVGLGETSFVMPFDYLRIVYAFLLGIVWFSEIPGWWSCIGAFIVIVSSLYLLKTENNKILG